jgi:hypothetical protein
MFWKLKGIQATSSEGAGRISANADSLNIFDCGEMGNRRSIVRFFVTEL